MSDAVTNKTLLDSAQYIAVHLTNISDGSGESAVMKIDKSAIAVASDGGEADALDLVSARWSIQGFTSVRISWDHGTDDIALVLAAGSGYEEFGRVEGAVRADPQTGSGSGDILLTTAGAVSGATYDITLVFKKRC